MMIMCKWGRGLELCTIVEMDAVGVMCVVMWHMLLVGIQCGGLCCVGFVRVSSVERKIKSIKTQLKV